MSARLPPSAYSITIESVASRWNEPKKAVMLAWLSVERINTSVVTW